MDIKFIGPARLSADGGVEFPATVNMENTICYFSYECLEDLDPEDLIGDALVHFTKHQLKLLSIAENKLLQGHAHSGRVEIYSSDLN